VAVDLYAGSWVARGRGTPAWGLLSRGGTGRGHLDRRVEVKTDVRGDGAVANHQQGREPHGASDTELGALQRRILQLCMELNHPAKDAIRRAWSLAPKSADRRSASGPPMA
jgi:hypothetical protein